MISVSQNEVAATTVKACRGVGVAWGLAYDAGYLAQYLAACDAPFLGSMLKVLETIDTAPQPSPADAALSGLIHAPVSGLALIEWIAATGKPWQGEVDAPLYLCAALAVFTAEIDIGFTVEVESGAGFGARGGMVRGSGGIPNGLRAHITCHKDMARNEKDEAVLPPPRPGVSVSVPDGCWERLMEYAHRTYVPESEHSRAAGAGAGDIDNE